MTFKMCDSQWQHCSNYCLLESVKPQVATYCRCSSHAIYCRCSSCGSGWVPKSDWCVPVAKLFNSMIVIVDSLCN